MNIVYMNLTNNALRHVQQTDFNKISYLSSKESELRTKTVEMF